MKTLTAYSPGLALVLLMISFASCKKRKRNGPEVKVDLSVKTVTNLNDGNDTLSLPFYYSLALNKQVTENEAWDLRFKRSTILTNKGGSSKLVDGVFSDYVTTFTTDFMPGSVGQWYEYDSDPHIVTPKRNKIIVVRTASGNYAKLEILSYYKDSPTRKSTSHFTHPEFSPSKSEHYTFKYVYQADGSTRLK